MNTSFLKRFYQYQKERFPFLAHGILISCFTFSAISYSLICRNIDHFIPWHDFIIGIFATITLFFLVRIFDEFKDQEEDRKYRSYLPVPRGLVSLKELKYVGTTVAILQISVILYYQTSMLGLYIIVLIYLALMGVEFFIPHWLKPRQMAYILSHMVIIPLIDIYASGLDWALAHDKPHFGLIYFFCVSFLNGLFLEFGRKIRAPEGEEEGVISYTGLYGTKGGNIRWMMIGCATFIAAVCAMYYAQLPTYAYILLSCSLIVTLIPGILFYQNPTVKRSKNIEYASALWTILLYLNLGGIPMIVQMINK